MMTIMTTTKVSHNWADPMHEDYRPDVIQLIKEVAYQKANLARNVWHSDVDEEDIQSELYIYLFTKPQLLAEGRALPAKLLHNTASNFCIKQQFNKGAAIIGTDTLHGYLQDFNNLPSYIREVLYGPVFAKAGKPAGTYVEIIEQEYKYKNKVIGESRIKTLKRAVVRLAEVISGVMVGNPESLDKLANNPSVPTYNMSDDSEDFDDETFAPYSATYTCSNNHSYRINTGAKPENSKIGQRNLLGYYLCKCAEPLILDSKK